MKRTFSDISEHGGGNCFETAWDNQVFDESLLICHGVATGFGPLAGYVYTHAWNEWPESGMCLDTSNGNSICKPIDFYYRLMGIDPDTVHKYDNEEAYQEASRTMKYGPWAPELQWEYKTASVNDIPDENQGGDCYIVALNNVLDDPDLYLCHGIVTGQGPLDGIRFSHAWNETQYGMVIDQSNGNDVEMPRELYYAIGQIDKSEVRYYNFDEMMDYVSIYGTYGPWDSIFDHVAKVGSGTPFRYEWLNQSVDSLTGEKIYHSPLGGYDEIYIVNDGDGWRWVVRDRDGVVESMFGYGYDTPRMALEDFNENASYEQLRVAFRRKVAGMSGNHMRTKKFREKSFAQPRFAVGASRRKVAFADTYVDLVYVGGEMYSIETHVEDSEYGVWVVEFHADPEFSADKYYSGVGSGDTIFDACNQAIADAGMPMSTDEREDYIGNLKFCVDDDMKREAGRKTADYVDVHEFSLNGYTAYEGTLCDGEYWFEIYPVDGGNWETRVVHEEEPRDDEFAFGYGMTPELSLQDAVNEMKDMGVAVTAFRKKAQEVDEGAVRDIVNYIKQNDLRPNDYPSDYDMVFDYAVSLISTYGVSNNDADWWVDEVINEATYQSQFVEAGRKSAQHPLGDDGWEYAIAQMISDEVRDFDVDVDDAAADVKEWLDARFDYARKLVDGSGEMITRLYSLKSAERESFKDGMAIINGKSTASRKKNAQSNEPYAVYEVERVNGVDTIYVMQDALGNWGWRWIDGNDGTLVDEDFDYGFVEPVIEYIEEGICAKKVSAKDSGLL